MLSLPSTPIPTAERPVGNCGCMEVYNKKGAEIICVEGKRIGPPAIHEGKRYSTMAECQQAFGNAGNR